MTVTVDNVIKLSFDEVRTNLFSLIRKHEGSITMERDLFVTLLGEYAGLYQYFSELYAFMIGKVREAGELKDGFRKMQYMDKRDCLEQALKAVKFNYDSLSRKVTILAMEDAE